MVSLSGAIQETDVTWIDLSLSFLWWRGGQTVGAEKIKGRFCYVVDLPIPEGSAMGLAGVRLWIDPQAHVMMRAAAMDMAGQMMRRLEVKSLKKIDEIWMVKDLEIRSYPSRHKTMLRVRSVEVLSDGPQPSRDGGAHEQDS